MYGSSVNAIAVTASPHTTPMRTPFWYETSAVRQHMSARSGERATLLAMIAAAEQNASKTAGRARSGKIADRRRRLWRMEEVDQRCKIRDAAYAAPNPLSMLTTVTPAAQLFSMESKAASPPKLAP